jgi:hypothetical protein
MGAAENIKEPPSENFMSGIGVNDSKIVGAKFQQGQAGTDTLKAKGTPSSSSTTELTKTQAVHTANTASKQSATSTKTTSIGTASP